MLGKTNHFIYGELSGFSYLVWNCTLIKSYWAIHIFIKQISGDKFLDLFENLLLGYYDIC